MLTRLMNPQQFGSVPPDIGIRLIGKSGFDLISLLVEVRFFGDGLRSLRSVVGPVQCVGLVLASCFFSTRVNCYCLEAISA